MEPLPDYEAMHTERTPGVAAVTYCHEPARRTRSPVYEEGAPSAERQTQGHTSDQAADEEWYSEDDSADV